MIIITEPGASEEQIEQIIARVQEFGLEAQVSRGDSRVIVGVLGSNELLPDASFASMPGIEAIVPAAEPYNLAAFQSRGAASTVDICGVSIGAESAVALICGPCSV